MIDFPLPLPIFWSNNWKVLDVLIGIEKKHTSASIAIHNTIASILDHLDMSFTWKIQSTCKFSHTIPIEMRLLQLLLVLWSLLLTGFLDSSFNLFSSLLQTFSRFWYVLICYFSCLHLLFKYFLTLWRYHFPLPQSSTPLHFQLSFYSFQFPFCYRSSLWSAHYSARNPVEMMTDK